MSLTLGAIVIARNEESMIANCLDALKWCDEILVINNDSSDATVGIAHRSGARVVSLNGDFATLRNEALKRSKTDWLFYVDADERVTPKLAAEIRRILENPEHPNYRLKRTNILYGQSMQAGGWENDYVTRLFSRESLLRWQGIIHESPVTRGSIGILNEPLIHLTHRSIINGLHKTIEWTPLEAKLLFDGRTPRVNLFTLFKKTHAEFLRRYLLKRGYRDGLVGAVESLVQALNRLLVYLQVWELQQRPSIESKYQKTEAEIANLWREQAKS